VKIARIPLPVAVYTEWYWKIDLHNLLHFLELRMDFHAQSEIREYANAMAKIVADAVPMTWEAFEDYQLNTIKLTGPEKEVINTLVSGVELSMNDLLTAAKERGLGKGEISEMVTKLKSLGYSIK